MDSLALTESGVGILNLGGRVTAARMKANLLSKEKFDLLDGLLK
jgi:hypothetical protein